MRLKNSDVVILSAKRSPIGKYRGALKDLTAPQIAGPVIKEVVLDAPFAGLNLHQVERLIVGHVLSAGVGQNPAKQAAFLGGLSRDCPAHGVNKVCASSLQALWDASFFARVENEIVIAGGMESMSQAPFLLRRAERPGIEGRFTRDDPDPFIDSMVWDGLTDAYGKRFHMGDMADKLARESLLSKTKQDEYAFESHRRAFISREMGQEALGICPDYPISFDEGVREPNFEKIKSLNPVFGETITAGNASQLSDGAAALLVSSYGKAKELGVSPLARIVAFADYSGQPEHYTKAPAPAAGNVLRKAGLEMKDIDLVEINEAFAVVPLFFMRAMNVPHEKVNIWGGAVAMGHPIGASGARIVVTLIHALRHTDGRYGLAVACHGGGGAVACIVENFQRRDR